MTIEFNCPNCNAVIGFADEHAGKRARCTTCMQLFIIPAKSFEKAKKFEPPKEKTEPDPGFYRAVFIDNWKLFIDPKNVTTLVFVIAVVCFKFISAGSCCCGDVTYIVGWGWLFGFYLNIIYETALEIDTLPEIYLGTSITFLWYIIKPFLVFLFTMAVVQLPFILSLSLLNDSGLTYNNMWQGHTGYHLLLQGLFLFGLFIFPVAILTIAVGRDISMFRLDYLLVPVFKAFVPYLVVVVLLAFAAFLETQTDQKTDAGFMTNALNLGLNLAVQILAIIAMRTIGLFYRHYSCHFQW